MNILYDMFASLFNEYVEDNDSGKVSGFLSDCNLYNVIIGEDGKIHYIDLDDRFNEDLEKGFCIYLTLYNAFPELYYEILHKFNLQDKHNIYKTKYSTKRVVDKNVHKR